MEIKNFINNQWVGEHANGKALEKIANIGPATGEVIGSLPRSGADEINQAVQAAKKAFPDWSQTTAEIRADFLNRLADQVDANAEALANAESLDQGKPVHLARQMDIARVAKNFRFFASAILQETSMATHPQKGLLNYVLKKPVGVAGLISPWNLPLYLLSWKIAPALACGNTVVAKPSELTSMTAHLFSQLAVKVGLPAGVLNIVYGYGNEAGQALVSHPEVPIISFTGGTQTGQTVIQSSAPYFKKLSLELGGKNANLIFADCDFEAMMESTLRSSFLNQGEICLCNSRLYIEESLYPRFVEEFVQRTIKLKVGPPAEASSFMGALVSRAHLEKVMGFIQTAKDQGGKILCGGKKSDLPKPFSDGFFLEPTVIADLPENSACIQEEIFGPVVTLSKFSQFRESIEKANQVKYGLSATVWTQDLTKALAAAEQLSVGTVWVNTWMQRDLRVPFGGQKASGVGREGGHHSIEFFTESTTVNIKY